MWLLWDHPARHGTADGLWTAQDASFIQPGFPRPYVARSGGGVRIIARLLIVTSWDLLSVNDSHCSLPMVGSHMEPAARTGAGGGEQRNHRYGRRPAGMNQRRFAGRPNDNSAITFP